MEKILRITGYPVENINDIREVAPAVFSGEHNRSRVYSFVSTTEILENLAKLGWNPTYAKQQGSSKFSRHIIRLTNPDLGYMPFKNDRVRPQLILDNSHNGGSSAQLHPGLFRMVCESELVIAISDLFSGIKFRHMGMDFEELKEILNKMSEVYKAVGIHIAKMQDVILSPENKLEFALKAVGYRDPRRFIKSDGTFNVKAIKEAINLEDILQPLRGGDKPENLWDIFNTIREWLIKGGFEQKSEKGRKSRSKAINNAVRQIEFNKDLWKVAEEYLGETIELNIFNKMNASAPAITDSITTPSPTVIEAVNSNNGFKIYTTAKGEQKEVEIIADLGNGRMQVKDVKANRIFAVNTDKLN